MHVSSSGGSRSVLVAIESIHTASLHTQALPEVTVDHGTGQGRPSGTRRTAIELNFALTSAELQRDFTSVYSISSADSLSGLILRVVASSTSIRLQLDFASSSTPLQRNPVFGNAVASGQEMP